MIDIISLESLNVFRNAIDSLETRVEDFEYDDQRRNFSAVRNIFTLILLLYKEKLWRIVKSRAVQFNR
jgi:hypothetical protein